MTNVLIAVDDTESSVTAAQTARRLFGDDADYTVISVSESEPVYWGDDPLGSGVAYPLAVPPVGSGMGMAAMALSLNARGAQAVIAACTEVPLVLSPDTLAIPIISSTDALVARAIAFATGR